MKRNLVQTQDIFMTSFKYYKSNKPAPSLDKVIRAGCNFESIQSTELDSRIPILGLQDPKQWMIYKLENHPGLVVIKNPFTSLGQRYWIRRCLEEYPRKPNKTNIDIEKYIEHWWMECYKDGDLDKAVQKKLRWVTLGYHHNWDTKVYTEENRNEFPLDLAELCDIFALHLGFKDFKAQASIVNYYHMGSTLSAHTDHSEVNLEAPLFSFSFGQSAIFLIGGETKSSQPSPILLNSGDVLVMSKESRLCYHAVPKILPAPNKPWNSEESLINITDNGAKMKYIEKSTLICDINMNIDNGEWDQFNSYVETSRININVRQVLNENETKLHVCNT